MHELPLYVPGKLIIRSCASAPALMGIYPVGKVPPGVREKSPLTEEHTQGQEEELSCPNCSALISDEAANFCPKCGAAQQVHQAETNEEPTLPEEEELTSRRRLGGPEGPSGEIEGPSHGPSGPSAGRIR